MTGHPAVVRSSLKGDQEAAHGSSDSELYDVIELILQASSQFGYLTREGEVKKRADLWCARMEKMEDSPNRWIKFVKYKISAFYAAAHKQELPPCPDGLEDDRPNILIGGRWCRWFKLFKRDSSLSRFHSFLFTLLQGVKKGCPRANQEGLQEAEKSTFCALTGPAPLVTGCGYDNGWLFDIRDDCDRTVDELFEGKTFNLKDFLVGFPSTSATYYHSRSKHGAVAEVAKALEPVFDNTKAAQSCLPQYRPEDRVNLDPLQESKFRRVVSTDEESQSRFTEMRSQVSHQMLWQAIKERPVVKPVALAEALKVRVITKGPALTGYVLAPLQKFLHRTLRNHPTFLLIGEPVTEDVLRRRLGELPVGMKWLSGDYKDATDGLMSFVSDTICNRICDHIFKGSDLSDDTQENLRKLFLRSLTGHEVDYGGNILPQTNGQLMGSIVSFPVLCIANAALCRRVIEFDARRRIPLHRCPLLINGDDCIFPSTDAGFIHWKECCMLYNMKPSVGKTYHSDEFLNINSTLFLYVRNVNGRTNAMYRAKHGFWLNAVGDFNEVKYINYGLVKHKKRSGGIMGPEDIFDKFCNFGQNSKDLLNTLPEFCKTSVYNEYLREFGRIAKKCNIKIPWFVPQCYGGIGIRPYGEWQCSRKDRRVCSLLKKDNVKFPNFSKDQTWVTHKAVVKVFDYADLSDDSDQYDHHYGLLCTAVFFDSVIRHDFSMIYSDSIHKNTVALLRRAERIWAKSLPKTDLREVDPWLCEESSFPVIFVTSGSHFPQLGVNTE